MSCVSWISTLHRKFKTSNVMQLFGNTNFKKANKTHGFDTAVFPFSLTDLQSQRKEEKLLSFINHSLCVIYVHFFNFSSV